MKRLLSVFRLFAFGHWPEPPPTYGPADYREMRDSDPVVLALFEAIGRDGGSYTLGVERDKWLLALLAEDPDLLDGDYEAGSYAVPDAVPMLDKRYLPQNPTL